MDGTTIDSKQSAISPGLVAIWYHNTGNRGTGEGQAVAADTGHNGVQIGMLQGG
jgi:hypothetical protein